MLHHGADIQLLSVRDIGLPYTSSCTGQMLHQALGTWSDAQARSSGYLGTTENSLLLLPCHSYVNSCVQVSYQRPDYVLLSCAKAKNVTNG